MNSHISIEVDEDMVFFLEWLQTGSISFDLGHAISLGDTVPWKVINTL